MIKKSLFSLEQNNKSKNIKRMQKKDNSIILYTIVDTGLWLNSWRNESLKDNIPCFGVLGNLILSFSKLLNQKATHKPSAQYVLDEDYYKRMKLFNLQWLMMMEKK